MISLKDLRNAAKELNKVIDLEPPIEDDLTVAEFIDEIKGVLHLINPEEDEFTKPTQAVIAELSGDAKPKASVEDTAEEEEEETRDEEDILQEEEEVLEEDEVPEEDLQTQVENAVKLSELKEIAKTNPEFKGIRGQLSKYKTMEDLQDMMLDILEGKGEALTVVQETEPEDEPKAVKAPKENKSGPKKVGIVATIAECVESVGKEGISKEEILEILVEKFPDRNRDSMKSTVSLHIPGLMSKERFKIEKLENGKYRKA